MTMTRDDWLQLAEYLRIANEARAVLHRLPPSVTGTIPQGVMETLGRVRKLEIDPALWFRIGLEVGEQLKAKNSGELAKDE